MSEPTTPHLDPLFCDPDLRLGSDGDDTPSIDTTDAIHVIEGSIPSPQPWRDLPEGLSQLAVVIALPQIPMTAYAIKYGDLYVRDRSPEFATRPIYTLTAYLADVAIFMVLPSRDTMYEIKSQIGLTDVSALTVVEWAITETDANWQDPGE